MPTFIFLPVDYFKALLWIQKGWIGVDAHLNIVAD